MTRSSKIDRLIDILDAYVRRGPASKLIALGVLLLLGGAPFVGYLKFNTTFPGGDSISGYLQSAENTDWATGICQLFGALLIIAGLVLIFRQHQEQSRKRILAVEIRGLSGTLDTPLLSAVPKTMLGRREPLLIDVRDLVQGTPAQQQEAVTQVNLLLPQLKTWKSGANREDLTLFAGGLAPVPLQFLAGNLLAAEGHIHWRDWDRKPGSWVSPTSGVDVPAPNLPDISELAGEEVILAVSLSYPIDKEELRTAFSGLPLVELGIPNATPGLVFSERSIQQLMQDFMNTLVAMQRQGVRSIHLVLAAPSVPSFRLGAAYAGRNMPKVVIYQYQKDQPSTPYPWGVEMPNSECKMGVYIRHTAAQPL